MIAEDPLYGRVICRCETVTEGEIVEAIHRPIVPVPLTPSSAAATRVWGAARADSAAPGCMRSWPVSWVFPQWI